MKYLIAFAGLVYIEISSEYDGVFATHLFNLADNQLGTFATCHYSDMVHVQVKEPESELACNILEFSPCTDAGIG